MTVSMEPGCSSQPRSRVKKSDKRRHAWSNPEIDALVALLKELVTTGWKSDNGFRVGYLKKLEDGMLKIFPRTDIGGMPHINTKITVWKKLYDFLVAMLGKTGVGLTHTTKMIECTDELGDLIVKDDPNAVGMRIKKWPQFDDWVIIVGKDRAT